MDRRKQEFATTYDAEVDAAYIYLAPIEPSGAVKTYCCDPSEIGGTINLDFDAEGRLIGIEVLDASSKLPRQFIHRHG